ncbi:MAG: patatin-like phospholipase family protein [Granulosicoccaceae bacterium]
MTEHIGRINLALQGGGAHGAFSWGVLDRLLEEPSLEIEGISGASAGAMNAACVAFGLVQGGNEQARAVLDKFWSAVAVPAAPVSDWFSYFKREGDLPGFGAALVKLSQSFSPYQLNPFNVNPLKAMLGAAVDIECIAKCEYPKLFIAATEVQSGRLRVFRNSELSTDVFLASACLPSLHHAVNIDGVSYWDGGFSANPPLTPLVFDCESDDIVLIMLEPMEEEQAPKSSHDIRHRTAALNFSTPLHTELRVIEEMQAHAKHDKAKNDCLSSRLQSMRIQMIEDGGFLGGLHKRSRINTQRDFLSALKAQGRLTAEQWLEARKSKGSTEQQLAPS